MKTLKKSLAMLLALVMSLGCMSVGAWATDGENVIHVATADELRAAEPIATGKTVIMDADITLEAIEHSGYDYNGNKQGIIITGGTLNGNGHKLSLTGGGDTKTIVTTGGTIQNLTIDSGFRGISIWVPTTDVVLDNVTLDTDCYGLNTAETGNAEVKLIVTNSTLKGWSSYSGNYSSIVFADCSFSRNTHVYSYSYVRPYCDTTFTKCQFSADFEIGDNAADLTYTFKGCEKDGSDLTKSTILGSGLIDNTDNCTESLSIIVDDVDKYSFATQEWTAMVATTDDEGNTVYVDAAAETGGVRYETLAEAVANAQDAGTVTLLSDVDLSAQVVVSKKLTLDLNGKKIYNTSDIWNDDTYSWSLISVQEGGDLTITGNGSLEARKNDCYAVDVREGAKVTIESTGKVVGNVHAVYVLEGSAEIKNGIYSVQQKYSATQPDQFVLNLWDYNRSNGTATMTVTGGTFEKFNPGDCEAEGKGTNFLANGYKSFKTGTDEWTVKQITTAKAAEDATTTAAAVEVDETTGTANAYTASGVIVSTTSSTGAETKTTTITDAAGETKNVTPKLDTEGGAEEALGNAVTNELIDLTAAQQSALVSELIAAIENSAEDTAAAISSIDSTKIVLFTNKESEEETQTEQTSVTYEIHPELIAYKTTGNTTEKVGSVKVGNEYLTGSTTVKLPVEFTTNYARYTHYGTTTETKYVQVKGETGNKYIEVTLDNFSQVSAWASDYSYAANITAADTVVRTLDDEKYALQGDTIEVPVKISGEAFAGIDLALSYDTNVFEYQSATVATGVTVSDAGKSIRSWGTNSYDNDVTVATLIFKVKDNAADGEYTFTIGGQVSGKNYAKGDFGDATSSTATVKVLNTFDVTLDGVTGAVNNDTIALAGADKATYMTNYTATVAEYNPAKYVYKYTVKVSGTALEGMNDAALSSNTITVDGESITGPVEITVTVTPKQYDVELVTAANTATLLNANNDGEGLVYLKENNVSIEKATYGTTFSAKIDQYNAKKYAYTVTYTVAGITEANSEELKVFPINEIAADGTVTVPAADVLGNITITLNAVAKTYSITDLPLAFTGVVAPDDDKLIADTSDAPSYGTNYVLKVDDFNAAKYTYTVKYRIGDGEEQTLTIDSADGNSIPGSSITDDITIISAVATPKTYSVTQNDAPKVDATYGTTYTVTIPNYEPLINTYTVKYKIGNGNEVTVLKNQITENSNEKTGTFTIDGASILGNIVITITATLDIDVEVAAEYIPGWYLVIVHGNGDAYKYDGHEMYRDNRYAEDGHTNAFAYLVQASALNLGENETYTNEAAKAKISLGTDAAGVVPTDNKTNVDLMGGVTYNDGLITYHGSNVAIRTIGDTADATTGEGSNTWNNKVVEFMLEYLRLDVDSSMKVNDTDVAAVNAARGNN